jgi:hypothetical protein
VFYWNKKTKHEIQLTLFTNFTEICEAISTLSHVNGCKNVGPLVGVVGGCVCQENNNINLPCAISFP